MVKEKLTEYLAGKISIKEFHRWLIQETWDSDNELVYAIKLCFAEYTSGHLSNDELIERLREL